MTTDFIPRVGINLDHIATLRELRGTPYPSLEEAVRLTVTAGADQITVHRREDQRHIQDRDVKMVKGTSSIPLNLEMAVADPVIRLALRIRPDWVCLVPEKRQEVTTEGGLNLSKNRRKLQETISKLKKKGIRVSLFVEPTEKIMTTAAAMDADAVEIHTGFYCQLTQAKSPAISRIKNELIRIRKAGLKARSLGLGVHAGHGLDYENIRPMVDLQDLDGQTLIQEYNIGHSVVCRAAMVGLERAIREMVALVKAP